MLELPHPLPHGIANAEIQTIFTSKFSSGTVGIVGRTGGNFMTLVPYCVNYQLITWNSIEKVYAVGKKNTPNNQLTTHVCSCHGKTLRERREEFFLLEQSFVTLQNCIMHSSIAFFCEPL